LEYNIWAEFVLNTKVSPRLNEFVSFTFEDVCIQYLKKINLSQKLPFVFEKIGRWWDQSEEIDIVAVGEKDLLLGECKWNENRLTGPGVLNALKLKSAKVGEAAGKTVHYILFSRSGFTEELIDISKRDKGVILVGLGELR
jgi:AAA+ ATPase superfamily predicted ATPase